MIKPTELLLTANVRNKSHRYYNVKQNSCGGNGKGTNKGNSNIGGWNRGCTSEMLLLRRERLFCLLSDKPKSKPKRIKVEKIKPPRKPKVRQKRESHPKTKIIMVVCKLCNERKWFKDWGTNRQYCSRHCRSVACFNTDSAANGRKAASKLKTIATGRKIQIIDGARKWVYPFEHTHHR